MKRGSSKLMLVFLVSLVGFQSAHAEFFNNGVGLVSPEIVVTFDEIDLSDGEVVTDQFAAFGVTFSPNLYRRLGVGNYGYGFVDEMLVNFTGNGNQRVIVTDFTIEFAQRVNGAAFAAVDTGAQFHFEAMLDGNVVDNGSLLVDGAPGVGFVGFRGVVFDSIRVLSNQQNEFGLDSLQYVTVQPPNMADGDINLDGSVNAADLLLAQRYVLQLESLLQEQIQRGDLAPAGAGDGMITVADLVLLMQRVLQTQ